jgi:hypothetical protein
MPLRHLPCGVLLGLLLLPVVARSDEKQSPAPMLVVRVRSLNTIKDNLKLLTRLLDKEEVGEQFEALINARIGPKGLEGIDPTRPVGMYSNPGEDTPLGTDFVFLVPVADQKAFLGLLENLNFKAEKSKDGLYLIRSESLKGVPVGLRFAHKYAYVAILNLSVLASDRLLEPSRVFPPNLKADLSAAVRIDRLPKTAKDLALTSMEERLVEEKEKKKPGETEVQHKARGQLLDAFAKQLAQVLDEGRQLAARLKIDHEHKELNLQLELDAKPGSALAKDIRELGQEKSLFAGLRIKGAALNVLTHLVLPEAVRQALKPVFEQGLTEMVQREKDPAKRRQAEEVRKLLQPTLEAGQLDFGFSLRGPNAAGHYTFVAGLRVKNGAALERALHVFYKGMSPDEQALIHLDVASAGTAKIHRIDAQKGYDASARAAFGKSPVYLAIRADAVLLALGDDGLEAIKQAALAPAKASPPLLVEISMARLARALTESPAERQAADKAFGPDDPGTVRLTLTGGNGLRLQLTARLSVLRFAATAYQERKQQPEE